TPLHRADAPWLGGAVVTGGLIGPVLMMFGLMHTGDERGALLLNLEGVFTALLAWFVFREHFDARIALGMAAIGAGALLRAWQPHAGFALDGGALRVGGVSHAWAIENNRTGRVSGGDPVQIAAIKGAVAGTINLLLAVAGGAMWPRAAIFFSSRRRHTRLVSDWSSDVCSSD